MTQSDNPILTAALARIDSISAGEILAAVDQLSKAGDREALKELYRVWLEHHGGDPLEHLMLYNYGALLLNSGDGAGAKDAFERAIAKDPNYLPAQINLGCALERMGDKLAALGTWFKVLDGLPQVNGENLHFAKMTLAQAGRVLEQANLHSKAEEAFRRCLELDIDQPEVVRHYLSMRQQQCKWPIAQSWGNANVIGKAQLLPNIDPLTLGIYSDDPMLQLTNSYFYSRINVGDVGLSLEKESKASFKGKDPARLRIGYMSSDLRQHAVGYLTAEIFEQHDRDKVEIFIYHSGPSADDPIGRRIRAAVEHWTDITAMPDEQAARLIAADRIQILVDLNGHTSGVRAKVQAMRPAPVLVNWLGYPGTVATPFHNYIIADPFIIPPDLEIYYSEKVMRIPCYQPNDRKRAVGSHCPTRAEAGLPEGAMVYCAFNGQHKITPFTWARWMAILRSVEGSVLWMLDSTQEICDQLRRLAEAHGVAADRLIFAPRIANPDHLARYPLADLFLDTTPYGAHTTASDAMWMGVPIITLAGRSFASRVCGSIIRSAGLDELVCTTSEQFVKTAVELGRHRERLTAIRERLRQSRESCVLFDTPLLVRELEARYGEMWQEYRAGKLPVPRLANMDVYREIAIGLDGDTVESGMRTDYEECYRAAIERRRSYLNITPDGRFAD